MKEAFGCLKEPEKCLRVWEWFRNLALDNPFAAAVCAAALVFLLLLALREWIRKETDATTRAGRRRKALGLLGLLLVSLVPATAIVVHVRHNDIERPTIDKFDHDQVGLLDLRWAYKRKDSYRVVYMLQASSDRNFRELDWAQSMPFATFVDRPPATVHGTRFWRVGATPLDDADKAVGPTIWSEPVEISYYPSVLARIRATRSVRVGFASTYNDGWFLYSTNNGRLAGFDYMLAQKLVEHLGQKLGMDGRLRVVVRSFDWTELLQQPRAGSVDMIISMISSLRTRESSYSLKFSYPYYAVSSTIVPTVAHCDAKADSAQMAFENAVQKQRAIVVQAKTTSADLAQLIQKTIPHLTIRQVDNSADLNAALRSAGGSTFEFALLDSPLAEAYLRDHPTCVAVQSTLMWKDLKKLGVPEADVAQYRDDRHGRGGGGNDEVREGYAVGLSERENELIALVNEGIRGIRLDRLAFAARVQWQRHLAGRGEIAGPEMAVAPTQDFK